MTLCLHTIAERNKMVQQMKSSDVELMSHTCMTETTNMYANIYALFELLHECMNEMDVDSPGVCLCWLRYFVFDRLLYQTTAICVYVMNSRFFSLHHLLLLLIFLFVRIRSFHTHRLFRLWAVDIIQHFSFFFVRSLFFFFSLHISIHILQQ